MRRELGRKAKGILHDYATELPRLFQPILVDVNAMLIQKGIIDSQSTDPSTLGMSTQLIASKLYKSVVTSLESNPSKFPELVGIFRFFYTLTTIAEELEEAGTSIKYLYMLHPLKMT